MSLGVTLDAWAYNMDGADHQADIAKTYENTWFYVALEGWKGILEAWRSPWLSCWHAGWQLAGWLAARPSDGGWCWLGGWLATGTTGAEDTRSGGG